jgi:hypothetical protein
MDSVNALMTGLIDYAGLFPPAKLEMSEAVRNYAGYLDGADSAALGKFILPADRLDEFETHAAGLLPAADTQRPWLISVLVGDDVESAFVRVAAAERKGFWSDGRLRIASLEIKLAGAHELEKLSTILGSPGRHPNEIYVEVAASDDVQLTIPRLKAAGARAKLRAGGVTAAAFPTTHRIVRFLRACHDSGVAFKATAGLHHPVRAQYPLTYEPHAERSTMFGFLNVFLAAAFMWNGADDHTAAKILDEADAGAFAFTGPAISWRGQEISANRIAEARRAFAISFGSCSFREPVDELELLLKGAAVS